MINFSRRQLARYAVDQLLANKPVKNLAERLAGALIVASRSKELELLLLDIDQELEDRGLLARANITSARQLSESLSKELSTKIKMLTGAKTVTMTNDIDRRVLGGLRVQTANHTWDKTIKKKLMAIKELI